MAAGRFTSRLCIAWMRNPGLCEKLSVNTNRSLSIAPTLLGTKAKRPPRGINRDTRTRPYRYGVTVGVESQHTGCISGSKEWTRDRIIDDMMIRRFVYGTFLPFIDRKRESIIVKRTLNTITVAMFIAPRNQYKKVYFLVGYAEKLMSAMFGCKVRLELQTFAF